MKKTGRGRDSNPRPSIVNNSGRAAARQVYEGERPFVRDNNLLGSYVIDRIPPGPRGTVKFDTTFSIDADGILTVSSRERKTGISQQITIGSDQHRLSRQEVQAMLREAELYRAQVRHHPTTHNDVDSISFR